MDKMSISTLDVLNILDPENSEQRCNETTDLHKEVLSWGFEGRVITDKLISEIQSRLDTFKNRRGIHI